jgi:hypothetical protein
MYGWEGSVLYYHDTTRHVAHCRGHDEYQPHTIVDDSLRRFT